MKKVSKRLVFLTLAATMVMSVAFGVTANAFVGIAPMVAITTTMTTDADDNEVNAGGIVNVNVVFRSVLVPNQLVTITTTNGAEVYNTAGIGFSANGVDRPISNLVIENNGVRFLTGNAAPSHQDNVITFQVKAPPVSGVFDISVLIGTGVPSASNSVAQSFTAVAGFMAESSHSAVVGSETFSVFGETGLSIGEGAVAFVIRHQETGEEATRPNGFGLNGLAFLDADGRFRFDDLSFSNNNPDGVYVISLSLVDFTVPYGLPNETIISIPISFAQSAPTATVSVQVSDYVVEGDAPFFVTGNFQIETLTMLAVTINHVNDPIGTFFADEVQALPGGTFTLGPFTFSDDDAEGMYVVNVALVGTEDGSFVEVNAQTTFEHLRPVQQSAITVSVSPNEVWDSQTYRISGSIDTTYAAPIVSWRVIAPNGQAVNAKSGSISQFTNGTFQTALLSFAAAHAEGFYTAEVVLLTQAGEELARETVSFRHFKTPVAVASRIENMRFAQTHFSVVRVNYGHGNYYRVRQSDMVTITGRAVDSAGFAAGNTTIRFEIELWRGGGTRSVQATTAANGNFTANIFVPAAPMVNTHRQPGAMPMDIEFGGANVVAFNANGANIIIPTSHRAMYIYIRSWRV